MNRGTVALRKAAGGVLSNIFEFEFVFVGPATSAPGFRMTNEANEPT